MWRHSNAVVAGAHQRLLPDGLSRRLHRQRQTVHLRDVLSHSPVHSHRVRTCRCTSQFSLDSCEIMTSSCYSMLAEKLNMSPDDAEKWIVNLIRNARLDAKIDSKLVSQFSQTITRIWSSFKPSNLIWFLLAIFHYFCRIWLLWERKQCPRINRWLRRRKDWRSDRKCWSWTSRRSSLPNLRWVPLTSFV